MIAFLIDDNRCYREQDPSLTEMSRFIQGYLEWINVDREILVQLLQDVCGYQPDPQAQLSMYVNEEGSLLGLQSNRFVPWIVGNIVVTIE
jgi:hypothetical protein